MMEKYLAVVPVDTSNAMQKGTILEFNNSTTKYQALNQGEPAGILWEAVAQNQNPAKALVLFHGIVFEDELVASVTEAVKAKLRKIGIFVEKRTEA